jgi:hypothetical protein
MNGYWFPWSPGVNGNTASDYVLAWRHVHDIFTKVGAKNVRWVWAGSTCRQDPCLSLPKLYPGDRYVDWTALDGYNRSPSNWKTGSEIFGDGYDQVTGQIAPHKPFMIPEVGCGEDPNDPARKANWLSRFFDSDIPNRLPETKAVVYFSTDLSSEGKPNYAVDSSSQSLAAYKKVAAEWRWSSPRPDITPPKIESLVATNRTSTGVALRNTNFRGTFSERMNTATLDKSTYKLFKCPTTTSTDCTRQITDVEVAPRADGLGATLNPYGVKTALLSANTRYKVVVTTEAKDSAGNFLDQNTSTTGYQKKEAYFETARR